MPLIIPTDRSRIETRQACERLRYLSYEYPPFPDEGPTRGRDLDQSAVALTIGSLVHHGIDLLIKGATLAEATATITASGDYLRLNELEDRELVVAMLFTWHAEGLPILKGWEILSSEREETFDYPIPGEDAIVSLRTRSDLIARAPAGATLGGRPIEPGVYVWNWKTCRSADERWRQAWLYDAQLLTELLGPEKRLGEQIKGVVIQGIVKENHPLVWCWQNPATGEIASRYDWQCEAAHETTHTKKRELCVGGKFHRLGPQWQRARVNDVVEGGQEALAARLQQYEPDLLKSLVVTLPPFRRVSNYEIDAWLSENLPREVDLFRVRSTDPLPDEVLHQYFPRRTANHNCIRGARFNADGSIERGQCPALGICWGGQSVEEFPQRHANHPEC